MKLLQRVVLEEQRMGTAQALTEKEQKVLTLCVVKEVLKLAQEKGITFEEEFIQDIFANRVDSRLAEMICKNIDALHEEKYISGNVEIVNEIELDEDFNETETDSIDFAECTFEKIEITFKGNAYLKVDATKEVGKDFYEKLKPIIGLIATAALQSTVDVGVKTVLRR